MINRIPLTKAQITVIEQIEKVFCIKNGFISFHYDSNGVICEFDVKQKERVTQVDRDLLLCS